MFDIWIKFFLRSSLCNWTRTYWICKNAVSSKFFLDVLKKIPLLCTICLTTKNFKIPLSRFSDVHFLYLNAISQNVNGIKILHYNEQIHCNQIVVCQLITGLSFIYSKSISFFLLLPKAKVYQKYDDTIVILIKTKYLTDFISNQKMQKNVSHFHVSNIKRKIQIA